MLNQLINTYKLKADIQANKNELISIADKYDPNKINSWKDYLDYQWKGDITIVPKQEVLSQRFGIQNLISIEDELVVINTCNNLKKIDKKVAELNQHRNLLESLSIRSTLVIYRSHKNKPWKECTNKERLKMFNQLDNKVSNQLVEKIWSDFLEL